MDLPSSVTNPMLCLNPADYQPRQIYKLMTGVIVPRPIALVATMSREGVANLAPFSFYSGVGANPPTVLFCPALRSTEPAETSEQPDLRKDTLRNVEDTGEFVINVVSEEMAAGVNLSSTDVPPEVDEFPLSGLTPIPSEAVHPPRVAESPVQMECKLLQVIYTGHEPRSGVIVLGQIVRFHIRENLVEELNVDQTGLNAVGRMSGHSWVRTRDRFEMILPK
jgi:flavin reductase (DIM6/NTAB) family NADH-FMN oxidoreductase RutF